MNFIPIKTLIKSLTSCVLFIISVSGYCQMPPVNVTNSTSGGDTEIDPCLFAPENQRSNRLTFSISNNFNSDIALTNFTKSQISFLGLHYNSISHITFDNDGHTGEGWPIWEPGVHHVTVHFNNDISSTNYDDCFILSLSFTHKNLTDRQYRHYNGSARFKAKKFINLPQGPKGGKNLGFKSSSNTDELNFENIKKTKLSIKPAGSTVLLELGDSSFPVTVFLAGITNVSYRNIIFDNKYLEKGRHEIQLDHLMTGVYQIIVQQGKQVKRLKYIHTNE